MEKVKEGLNSIEKECENFGDNLSDEELNKITGGSHMNGGKTYSDETYGQLGLLFENAYGQDANKHPLIIYLINNCKLSEGKTCASCRHFDKKGIVWYCRRRSEEVDYSKD